LSQVAARRRPLWRLLLVGLLLAFSLAVTTVYVATIAADFRQHHWAGALDASRDAVPAAVGWAALLIVFFARAAAVAEQSPTADERAVTEKQAQAALARESVRRAEQRVQRLDARLAELRAIAAQEGQDRQLARQIAATAARLDLARQWLIGARAALAASQPDVAKVRGRRPHHISGQGPPAGRVALLPVPALKDRQGQPPPDMMATRRISSAAPAAARAVMTFVCASSRSPSPMQLDATAMS
jgi:hypothetical protein